MDDIEKIKNACFTIKSARLLNNMTIREAATQIGVSAGTLSNYETGKTSPSVFICKRMEEVYHIPQERLIFITDKDCKKVLTEGRKR